MTETEPRVGLVLLAAGLGKRMGGPNKLLLDLDGAPVVRRSAVPLAVALGPEAPRVVVTGRDAESVAAALDGLGFAPVYNPRHAEGMGTSVAVGVTALPNGLDAVLIALGDMPGLRPETIRAMVAALGAKFDPAGTIVRPVTNGVCGNPVLWGAAFWPALAALEGDQGGRDLIREHAAHLREVIVDDPAVARDIDLPADLEAAQRSPTAPPQGKRWS